LSEAFTKPKMMQTLGKVGFTQSYTYFTWRTTPQEMREYATELTQSEMRWYYRGEFWPNTPDILPHELQNAPASNRAARSVARRLCLPPGACILALNCARASRCRARRSIWTARSFRLRQARAAN